MFLWLTDFGGSGQADVRSIPFLRQVNAAYLPQYLFSPYYDTPALCPDLLSQIFHRYLLREPDSIHRAVKRVSVTLHIPGTDKINYRLSMAFAYFDRSLCIRRQVHIQPRLRDQSLFINGCRKLFAVPWYRNSGGSIFSSSTSTGIECPWFARISVWSSL